MGSEDISQSVLSNSRYIGNGRTNRLIYNYIPTFNLSPTIKLNYSTSVRARTLNDNNDNNNNNNFYNYQLENQWIGKTYPQRRSDDKNEIIRGHNSREINHFRKNIIHKVSSKVIPIPISSHASSQDSPHFSSSSSDKQTLKIQYHSNSDIPKLTSDKRSIFM